MDILGYSVFWLLEIILLWTFMYRFFVWICFQCSWHICLDQIVTLCLTTWGTARGVFQSKGTILYSHQQCRNDPVLPCPCQHLLPVFLIIAIPVSMRWCLSMVCIWVSLVAGDVGILLSAYWLCVWVFFAGISFQILCPFFYLGCLFIIEEL